MNLLPSLPSLRLLAWIKRTALALESIAESQLVLATLARDADDRRIVQITPTAPKPMVVGSFSQAEASRRWREDRIARGVSTEEELDERYGNLS
jgi:hypothetical protein